MAQEVFLPKPHWWDDGVAHVRAADPLMGALMDRFSESYVKGRGDAFATLLRSVVGQQISVKAAASIWGRFLELFPKGELGTPQDVLGLSEGAMRGAGLSGSKVKYMRGIAQGFTDGTVHPGLWDGMEDEAIIKELVKLPGIGRWTAEMFLFFCLMRPNVLPVGDLGLLNGYVANYGVVRGTAKLEGPARLRKIAAQVTKHGAKWHPYRSVAVWFLWRSLDPVEVQY